MIPLAPEIALLRPDSIPITVMVFEWGGKRFHILEFMN